LLIGRADEQQWRMRGVQHFLCNAAMEPALQSRSSMRREGDQVYSLLLRDVNELGCGFAYRHAALGLDTGLNQSLSHALEVIGGLGLFLLD
jgi:hypothetical protein